MTRLEERIRTGLHQTAERIPDTAPITTSGRRRGVRPTGAWISLAAVAAVVILFGPILLLDRHEPAGTTSPFLGTWVSVDADLSQPTMVIEVSTESVVEMVVTDEDLDDDFDSVCSGASSTLAGTGTFEEEDRLVFPSPTLTCDDGSEPRVLEGAPIDERLRNLTFTYRSESDTLLDSLGELWTREGVQSTSHPLVRWPQASLEEVEVAQALADAGDPNFTWQLEPNMESSEGSPPELLARAVHKRFGWEESVVIGTSGGTVESEGIMALELQLIRCDRGRSNPIWPNDPVFGGCAPTIDDFTYESVEVLVAQPGKKGPEGIWVLSVMPSEPYTLRQFAPMTDAEVAAIVEPFLEARVTGDGAEQYLGDPDGMQHFEIGYLYSASTGAPYERAAFEIEDGTLEDQGPLGGSIGILVRLFAEGGDIVVEQTLELEMRADYSWAIYQHDDDGTTENGVTLPPP